MEEKNIAPPSIAKLSLNKLYEIWIPEFSTNIAPPFKIEVLFKNEQFFIL